MANLTISRSPASTYETLSTISLPLAVQHVYKNGGACYDTSALGSVKKAAGGSATLIAIGLFDEDMDNSGGSAGSLSVLVKLQREIRCFWFENGGNITLASNLFGLAYWSDDHTLTATSTSNSIAGRIWDVDATKGVLIEFVGNTAVL